MFFNYMNVFDVVIVFKGRLLWSYIQTSIRRIALLGMFLQHQQ